MNHGVQCSNTMRPNEDEDDGLCCCEFISSSSGERRHLLQLCCDCAEIDDAVDRLVSGRGVPDGRAEKVRKSHSVSKGCLQSSRSS